MRGPSQRLHTVTGLQVCAFAHTLYDIHHRLSIQYARDIVRDGGGNLTIAGGGKVTKQRAPEFASDGGQGIAVKKQKRRGAMAAFQEIERFAEGDDPVALGFPFCRARRRSFRIKAVLRATSLARSSVDADNRLPVPVFDKSGSGL